VIRDVADTPRSGWEAAIRSRRNGGTIWQRLMRPVYALAPTR
jgi:hypothetical protein